MMTLIFVPVSLFFLQTERVFKAMGFDGSASHHSQLYLTAYLPGIYFLALFDSNRRFLNAVGHQNGPMLIQAVATGMHIIWCYIFVDYLDLGARGAGIASSISFFTLMICLYKYTELKLESYIKEKAWFSPFQADSKADCFDKKGLIDYFKHAVPSTCMLCMESWAFHIMTLLSALISVKATAVQVISLNIGALFYMPTLGL